MLNHTDIVFIAIGNSGYLGLYDLRIQRTWDDTYPTAGPCRNSPGIKGPRLR